MLWRGGVSQSLLSVGEVSIRPVVAQYSGGQRERNGCGNDLLGPWKVIVGSDLIGSFNAFRSCWNVHAGG